MARKLSPIARHAVILFAMAGPLSAAGYALAEDEIQRSAPPRIVQNPFASTPTKPAAFSERPRSQSRGATTYRNPFAANSTAPPTDSPLLPGPISRWRRTEIPINEPSPVKSAILSAELSQSAPAPWDQLPPAENLRERGNARRHSEGISMVAGITEPPDPIHFTTETLTQPVWLTTDAAAAQPFSPIGQAAFEQPLSGNPLGSPIRRLLPAPNAADDAPAFFISDSTDSPENLLAEAQQKAHAAQSIEDLSTIVDLCERILNDNPPGDLATPARRLTAWAHNRRGELLVDEGRLQEAVDDFQAAISLDPKCSLAIHNRAVTLAQQGDFDAALLDFNRVVELNPGLAVAYRNRAELLAAQGKMNEAVADYSRAIEAVTDDAELYRARAYAFQHLGQFARAMDDLNRAIDLAPDAAANFTQRGNLLAERGEFEHALDDFKRALSIDPNLAEAHRSLAWLQATCPDDRYRDAEQALAAAQQAAKLSSPDDYSILDALAAAQASAGQFDEAVETQQQAINAAPPKSAEPMRQRLALYQQRQPFRSGERDEG